MPNTYDHNDGCPICGAKECERDSGVLCGICNTKCCHPNKKEWHWTQDELDAAKEGSRKVKGWF